MPYHHHLSNAGNAQTSFRLAGFNESVSWQARRAKAVVAQQISNLLSVEQKHRPLLIATVMSSVMPSSPLARSLILLQAHGNHLRVLLGVFQL
jgi:hypothetical protein